MGSHHLRRQQPNMQDTPSLLATAMLGLASLSTLEAAPALALGSGGVHLQPLPAASPSLVTSSSSGPLTAHRSQHGLSSIGGVGPLTSNTLHSSIGGVGSHSVHGSIE